ncbi:unnamed protein product, partial [Rotaria socialis]
LGTLANNKSSLAPNFIIDVAGGNIGK